jgi:hypothetical protein
VTNGGHVQPPGAIDIADREIAAVRTCFHDRQLYLIDCGFY